MLDFTKQIPLDQKCYSLYKKLQSGLYLLAFLSAVYFAYLILFPSAYFAFDFSSPNSLKNTVISPRNAEGNYPEHGAVATNGKLIFDTALVGNYGKAQIKFTIDKQSENPEGLTVSVRKSFQAYFYPEGALAEEKKADTYKVADGYYLLSDGKLKKFISENAFLSRYDKNKAIISDASIFKNYPLDENMIGYADGTLISYGISAYIVSSGKILPINNVITFSAMGYNWNDVVAASADEISFYEKDKLFTLSSTHPGGTIFSEKDTGKNYLVEDGMKKPVPNAEILKSLGKTSPISVSPKSLDTIQNCALEKEVLSFRTYACNISLENFKDLIGKDYELLLNSSDKEIRIDKINVIFKKQVSWNNFKATLRDLINKIMANYGIEQAA